MVSKEEITKQGSKQLRYMVCNMQTYFTWPQHCINGKKISTKKNACKERLLLRSAPSSARLPLLHLQVCDLVSVSCLFWPDSKGFILQAVLSLQLTHLTVFSLWFFTSFNHICCTAQNNFTSL